MLQHVLCSLGPLAFLPRVTADYWYCGMPHAFGVDRLIEKYTLEKSSDESTH